MGAPDFAAIFNAMLADLLCTQGRWDEAEALAREVSESALESALGPQALSRATLGRVLARRDEFEDAERLVGEALRLTNGVEYPDLRVATLAAAAEVAEAQGLASEARRLLEEAQATMKAKGNLVALERLDAALAQPVP